MQNKSARASLIIIGNEVLSGRTQDKNTAYLAEKLSARGIVMAEVRIIPDIEGVIVSTVNELRARDDYVFTTGGIGPTHDDITALSIAKAFGVELKLNDDALQAMIKHYGGEAEITDARKKMAMIPDGAVLIDNPVSGAPGFILGNVYVMAGVPSIMQGMFDGIVGGLTQGDPILSQSVTCSLKESQISTGLAEIQERYPQTDIGSYPYYKGGEAGVSVVVRSVDEKAIRDAVGEVVKMLNNLEAEPIVVSSMG